MYLKIIAFLLFLFQNIDSLVINCDEKTMNAMDKEITRLIVVGQKGIKFPTNERELRPYCNLALKTFDKINEYTDKCLPPFGRDATRVIMHTIGVELRGVCKTGRLSKRAKELLEAAPCANAGLKNWQKCNMQIIEKFTGILNAPIKSRIPMACCNFHQLILCLTEEAEDVKQCTRKTIDYVIKYINKLIDPIILILCGDSSESSDKCDRIVSLTPNRTDSQPIYKSVIIPVIEIAMSLDQDAIK